MAIFCNSPNSDSSTIAVRFQSAVCVADTSKIGSSATRDAVLRIINMDSVSLFGENGAVRRETGQSGENGPFGEKRRGDATVIKQALKLQPNYTVRHLPRFRIWTIFAEIERQENEKNVPYTGCSHAAGRQRIGPGQASDRET